MGKLPSGEYRPDPNVNYLCVYCNKPARLRDADIVVDCYLNVVHLACLEKEEVITGK